MFDIFLPIAGIHMNGFLLFMIGIGGGLVSNLLRIGSGVFVAPVLVMVGVPFLVAFPSQLINSMGTSLVGFWHYWRRFEVDFSLAWYLFLGGLIGAICEMFFYKYLSSGDHMIQKLNFIYGIILGLLSFVYLFVNARFLMIPRKKRSTITMKEWMIYLPFHRVFTRSRVEMSILLPLLIGISTGLLTTILGGGISMIVMPVVAYLIDRDSNVIAGTARLASFSITVVVALIQGWHHAVADWTLVLILFTGGWIGGFWGRKFTNFVPQSYLGIAGGVALFMLSIQFFYCLYHSGHTIAPSLKVNLSTVQSLENTLSTATGWNTSLLEFALNAPVQYTCYGILGILIITFIIEKYAVTKMN